MINPRDHDKSTALYKLKEREEMSELGILLLLGERKLW